MNIKTGIKKITQPVINYLQQSRSMLKAEQENVYTFCSKIFFIISLIMVVIFGGLMIFATPFFGFRYLILYSVSFLISTALLFGFYASKYSNGKFSLPLMYMFASYLYAFSILVSLQQNGAHSHAAAAFICLQIIFPILIFDNSIRINLFVIAVYAFHTILSYRFKEFSDFLLDAFNGAAFTIVGIIIGEYERHVRVRSFATDRILICQRNTDMLTNLPNRRALFERLAELETRPTPFAGLFMIDIDHFKQFNDVLGHQAGDFCLSQLGIAFSRWGKERNFTFYRYGGEEFIAITEYDTYDLLETHAENLRKQIEELAIPFPTSEHGVVTISIGFATYSYAHGYEASISEADSALYEAKRAGRNCVRGNEL